MKIILISILILSIQFFGFQDKPILKVPVIKGTIKIDGYLNDNGWKQAIKIDNFSLLGQPGKKPTYKTIVYLAYKNNYLYIAFENYEPHLNNIRAKIKENSLDIWKDDDNEIFFSIDKIAGSQILVNSLGYYFVNQKKFNFSDKLAHVLLNSIISKYYSEGTDNKELFIIVEDFQAKSSVDKKHKKWFTEIKLHLNTSLNKQKNGKIIYINFARHRNQGDQNYVTWSKIKGKTLLVPTDFLPVLIPNN